MIPEGFNGIEVWRLSRPVNYNDIIIWKPSCGQPGGVFWAIVLLKISLPLFNIQLFKAFHHSLIQNFTVLFCIHFSLNLYKLSHTIPAHITSYHKVIPSSMFDCGCRGLIRWGFISLFPHIHLILNKKIIQILMLKKCFKSSMSNHFIYFIISQVLIEITWFKMSLEDIGYWTVFTGVLTCL